MDCISYLGSYIAVILYHHTDTHALLGPEGLKRVELNISSARTVRLQASTHSIAFQAPCPTYTMHKLHEFAVHMPALFQGLARREDHAVDEGRHGKDTTNDCAR